MIEFANDDYTNGTIRNLLDIINCLSDGRELHPAQVGIIIKVKKIMEERE